VKLDPAIGATMRFEGVPVAGSTVKLRLPTPGSVTVKVPDGLATTVGEPGRLAGAEGAVELSAQAMDAGTATSPIHRTAAELMNAIRRSDILTSRSVVGVMLISQLFHRNAERRVTPFGKVRNF
jgi:hypothetical protein